MTSTDVVLSPGSGSPILRLVSARRFGEGRARELWLSNMTEIPPSLVVRLGRLSERVDKDFAEISTKVGAMDFEGRTFGGWHRHITLSAVAHAIVTLSALRGQAVELPSADCWRPCSRAGTWPDGPRSATCRSTSAACRTSTWHPGGQGVPRDGW
ncbi:MULTISPECIES: hypothetical protein [unclassified Streptomyces]|uniref:hypothetical protein n=1 Tax=unclassified Streptomyces TaxID=2593676 RepID=UPI00081DD0E3|nr:MULTISPECIES: hypothetical protein [unclassified Streptomyces]SCF83647.1 hypothetical protein GA0115259_1034010 [Streptomyces sp. MnatMP-M17]